MCGRFTNRLTWREIVALYRLSVPATPERNLPARYNICPTDTIDTVVEEDGKRDLAPMRWGLVPWWWKKRAKDVPATFNARGETISAKPMFRDAFKRRRCLIPASGYYEWNAASSSPSIRGYAEGAPQRRLHRARERRRRRRVDGASQAGLVAVRAAPRT